MSRAIDVDPYCDDDVMLERLRDRLDHKWMHHANCHGQHHLFFAPPGEYPYARQAREQRAQRLCTACPVKTPCRAWARAHAEHGYWGGESEEDRARQGIFAVDNATIRQRIVRKGRL